MNLKQLDKLRFRECKNINISSTFQRCYSTNRFNQSQTLLKPTYSFSINSSKEIGTWKQYLKKTKQFNQSRWFSDEKKKDFIDSLEFAKKHYKKEREEIDAIKARLEKEKSQIKSTSSSNEENNENKFVKPKIDPMREQRTEKLKKEYEEFKVLDKVKNEISQDDSVTRKELLDRLMKDSPPELKKEMEEVLRETSYTTPRAVMDRLGRPAIQMNEPQYTENEKKMQERLKYKRKIHIRNQWLAFFKWPSIPNKISNFLNNTKTKLRWSKERYLENAEHAMREAKESARPGKYSGPSQPTPSVFSQAQRENPYKPVQNDPDWDDVITISSRVHKYYPKGFTIDKAIQWADHHYVEKNIVKVTDPEKLKILRTFAVDLQYQMINGKPSFVGTWGGLTVSTLMFYVPYSLFYAGLWCSDYAGFYYLGLIPIVPAFLLSVPLLLANFHRHVLMISQRFKTTANTYALHLIIKDIEKQMVAVGIKDIHEPLDAKSMFHSTEHILEIQKKMEAGINPNQQDNQNLYKV